jgi:putative metallohydrolase (TIGR04338 family)
MKRERDSQRQRLYKAELVLRPISRRFKTMGETQGYVMAVWTDPNVRALFDALHTSRANWGSPPKIKDGRGRKHAGGCAEYITLPKWARTEYVILHELAHVFTQRLAGKKVAGHGWQFCQIYHRLVWCIMGERAAAVLMASYEIRHIKHEAPAVPRRRAAGAYATPSH